MEFIVIFLIIGVVSAITSFLKKERKLPDDVVNKIQRAFNLEMELPEMSERQDTSQPPKTVSPSYNDKFSGEGVSMEYVAPTNSTDNPYAYIDATSDTDFQEEAQPYKIPERRPAKQLRLFEDKNELVRAIIYSEILTRKSR